MEENTGLAEAMQALVKQYLADTLSLNTLVLRGEALLDQGSALMAPETHQRAMNCIYILEELNALALDERRSMRADERSRVAAELKQLTSLTSES